MNPRIETAVREAGIRAEWYATGILDTGTDSRVGSTECMAFGEHYARLARDFHEERRSSLRNLRDEWRIFIEKVDIVGRVTAGTAILDAVIPDWWQRIDPDRIEMGDARSCVCGLLGDGDWRATLDVLMVGTTDVGWYGFACNHGFSIEPEDSLSTWDWESGSRFDYLNHLWRTEVAYRQAALSDERV
jgi:hypothetical protein